MSIQTVSAVMNGKPGITEDTAARVRRAIAEVGYRPHSLAASLRTRKTRTIALIVSDIANPSLAVMASAAERYAQSMSYAVVYYNTHDDLEREKESIRLAAQRWIDGIVVVSAGDHMPSYAETLSFPGMHCVPIERIPEGYTGPCVGFDNVEAGRIAARHLLELGHTRLAHVSGPLALAPARDRCTGFQLELTVHGLPAPPCVDEGCTWDCESGYRSMRRILAMQPRPTAVFAANDRLAVGAMLAAHQQGLRIPADLSVVGLDDFETARYHIPPLTTIAQPFSEIATSALRLLFELLAGNQPANPQIILKPTLVVRESTGPVPAP